MCEHGIGDKDKAMLFPGFWGGSGRETKYLDEVDIVVRLGRQWRQTGKGAHQRSARGPGVS